MAGSPPNSPPNDSLQSINVLALASASSDEELFTYVLAEQLCCPRCKRISTRWGVPGGVPVPREPADDEPGKPPPLRSDPGE